MISLGARIVGAILRAYTYPYRKKHKSLSRSIKFKNKPYNPPKNCRYEIAKFNGTSVEILSPTNLNNNVHIVQFHGGGHTQSMNGMYRKVAERLCKISKSTVYSIDYEIGNELIYPSVHNECYSAYVELYKSKLKGKRIIAIGDSFGANLMLSTCLKLRDENIPLPNALISVSCYIDLAATGDSYKNNCYRDPLYSLPKNQRYEDNEQLLKRKTPYCGNTSPFNKLLSPAYANYCNFPDMLIQCGDYETSASDSEMLFLKLKSAGVKAKFTKYNGMWHDFQYLTPFLKESKTAWKEIGQFIFNAINGFITIKPILETNDISSEETEIKV